MDTTTAIRVKPEPDNYRCTWHIPHDGSILDLPGTLDLRPNRNPEGAIFSEIPGIWAVEGSTRSAGFPQNREFENLSCTFENGLSAFLLDCSMTIWAPNRVAIHAACALAGNIESANATEISRVKVQISGIDSLFGAAPIKGHSMPSTEGMIGGVGTWSVDQDPDSAQVWRDEKAEFTASFDSSTTMADPYYFRMCHSPSVVIDLANPIDFERVVSEWIAPLTDLIALALGKPQRVTYLAVGRKPNEKRGHWSKLQVYGARVHQEPYNSSLKGIANSHSVLDWRKDARNPLEALRAWQGLHVSHHPLVETYGSFLNVRAQHPRASYLLLLQALEGLHGYETHDAEVERGERHRAQKLQILETVKSCLSFSSGDRKFLKRSISNSPPKGLDSRLRESFMQVAPDVLPQLASTDLIKDVMTDPRKPHDAADALRIIRNDLAHGNKGYDVADLRAVERILERVTRAHFLRVLGYPTSVLERAMRDADR
ncbi:HEPN domain-containing protein [Streptomyces sp. NPDC059639]|uniref:ApeA N-terminal domain 1-containing protein n=1 Tax=Streptomyces sp. NPDC059639 TaxID=3346891 RepID=UPI00368F17D9